MTYKSSKNNVIVTWTSINPIPFFSAYASIPENNKCIDDCVYRGYFDTLGVSISDNVQCNNTYSKFSGTKFTSTVTATDYSGTKNVTPPDSITLQPGDSLSVSLTINAITTTRDYNF